MVINENSRHRPRLRDYGMGHYRYEGKSFSGGGLRRGYDRRGNTDGIPPSASVHRAEIDYSDYQPQEASIEELFFNTNAKTVIHVGEARGIAILACVNAGLEVNEYTPLQIKQGLVGYGRADKKQVQEMVKAILNLEEVPKPDDTADAVAAAVCHGHAYASRKQQKKLDELLKAQPGHKLRIRKGI